jgi:hypothetical protein
LVRSITGNTMTKILLAVLALAMMTRRSLGATAHVLTR